MLRGGVWIGCCFAAFLYFTQDLQVFPSAVARLAGVPVRVPDARVERFTLRSIDGAEIETWRLAAEESSGSSQMLPYRALFMHGNGGSLENFYSVQRWLASLGITNYSFDYRGTGASSGWPSEAGIALDARMVFDHLLKRESVSPEQVIIVGLSIGTGFASGLAREVNPKALVLLAPYRSMPQLVDERPLLRYFKPLLRYQLATEELLPQIQSRCILMAHGEADSIIGAAHTNYLRNLVPASANLWYKVFPGVNHNDLFYHSATEVGSALKHCLAEVQ